MPLSSKAEALSWACVTGYLAPYLEYRSLSQLEQTCKALRAACIDGRHQAWSACGSLSENRAQSTGAMLCTAADLGLIEHMRAILAGLATRQATEDTRNSAVRCLGIAAVRGDVDVVDELLKAFGNDLLFATPFNIREVCGLRMEAAPQHPRMQDGTCTALMYLVAARNASTDVARRLVDQGGRRLLKMCEISIGSPLSIAFRNPSNVDMVDLLLDAYETMPGALSDGYLCQTLWTAVKFAWDYGRIARVLGFVGPYFIANTSFVEGDLLFHIIDNGRVDVFRLFLEAFGQRFAEVRYFARHDWYAQGVLYGTIAKRQHEMTRMLLEHHGAEVTRVDTFGRYNPLNQAIVCGDVDLVRAIVEASDIDAILDAQNNEGFTSLDFAVYHSKREIVEYLLGVCSNEYVMRTNSRGCAASVMWSAVDAKKSVEMCKLLLDTVGMDLATLTDNRGETVLHYAASSQSQHTFLFLRSYTGVELVYERDNVGKTGLMEAVSYGKDKIVKAYLGAGGERLALMESNCGDCALRIAMTKRDTKTALLILKLCRSLFLPVTRRGWEALVLAIEWDLWMVARSMLKIGGGALAAYVCSDKVPCTALHVAVREHNVRMARLVLAHGRDGGKDLVMATNCRGSTPLHFAVNKCQLPVIDHVAVNQRLVAIMNLLFSAGGSDLARCQENVEFGSFTALHIAVYYRNLDFVKLILQYGREDLLLVQDARGETALHAAARSGSTTTWTEVLRWAGARCKRLRREDGCTARELL